jgi:Ohr subfamily peroxiredoxin
MAALYTAVATATGEGRNGEVLSSDGVLDEKLSVPKSMGGPGGDFTNPEQLFAAGYAACFHSALKVVASRSKTRLPQDTSITASVGVSAVGEAFVLNAELQANLPGLTQEAATALIEAAHQVCPYSNATRGNIEVKLTVSV